MLPINMVKDENAGSNRSVFEHLKVPDIILSLFLHKNWTRLILLAPTVYQCVPEKYSLLKKQGMHYCYTDSDINNLATLAIFKVELWCFCLYILEH